MVAGRCQGISELRNARLVGDRRMRIGSASGRLGRIVPPQAVNVVHVFGPCVIRLEFFIADRPGRGDAVVMAQLGEITFPQAIERGAEQLGRPAHEIMHLRLKRPAVAVVPGVGRDVAIVLEHRRRIPVVSLASEPVATLEKQDVPSRRCEASGKRATAGSAANDDDVEAFVHGNSIRDQRCYA